MIVFTNKLFGTTNHLMYDSGYAWIDEIPSNAFVYDEDHPYSISEWFSITGSAVPDLVQNKYHRMAEELNIENPSWHKLLGASFKKQLKSVSESANKMILDCDYMQYEQTWRECQEFMWSMKPAKINRARYASLKALNVKLPGFNPVTGSLDPVRYNRKTKTGRLKVVSGPSVLTLSLIHI